ncbi:MAG TPA: sugar phosphate nucleotidyltransferase, partial [Acidimicrobiales bacterium]|nr:sugar phosphate nucleotidyltransferase [Acidimicrobiales bacterium]
MPAPGARPRTLALVMAGGAGGRMGPLTRRRAKPALPFGGSHRLIDFPLSNCANSGISDVWVVQQYLPHALEDHLSNGRPWDLDRTSGGLLLLHPFTGGDEGGFHRGNADSLWRHRHLIADLGPDVVLVLSADAVYTLDYRDVVDAHLARDADVTMATTRVKQEDASRFGVVGVDGDGRVREFCYKPDEPATDLVTMEVFAYRPATLAGALERLADEQGGLEDFGDVLLPALVAEGRAFEHRVEGYWRDVGTPESYWRAHRDLLDGVTGIDLDDPRWPVRTNGRRHGPARLGPGASVEDSLVGAG